ncbi:SLC13 family permease [Clostridium vitabionis]|uniref:SLC13 family permease n=1 Tax=Clostridium vitabionis TaxID=2784388 RepID=UPI00188B67AB|nr:SLC13 family permease [Clostridium vitabionis]
MATTTLCLAVFAAMVFLFFLNKFPMWATAMGCALILVVTGCIDGKSALASFGSSTVITMASMFVVAAGLSRTQMVNHISRLLLKVTGGSFTKVLAAYVLITVLLGQFVPSIVALFALVYPLANSMCKEMHISPSKMMYPLAIASVSCSFIIEPIGPYAAWYVTLNGYLENYGWTASKLTIWSETAVLLPVGIMTMLLAIFVVPKFLPEKPDMDIVSISDREIKQKEPLSPIREFLGYAVFIAVIIGLMAELPSWQVTTAGAVILVIAGVLSGREAIENLNMDTIILYVGVVIMGNALGNTGAAESIGNGLASVLGQIGNGYVIGFAIYVVAYLMTSFLYNRAVTTVLQPLVIMTCANMGCDPRGPMILCSLASMSSLITPMSTAVVPMAMSVGGYNQKSILKAGWVTGLLRGIVGALIAMTIFPAF